MSRSIVFFVDEIESTFVMKDIKLVAAKYDQVHLFSIEALTHQENLPQNVILYENFMDWKRFSPIRILAGNFFQIMGIYLNECLTTGKLLKFKSSIALLTSNIFKAEEIIRHSGKQKLSDSVSYSFWFYDCIYLAWLKKKGVAKTVIARAHSGDLYEDHISIRNKVLFRNFQFKHLQAVFPVSEMGTEYLRKKYKHAKAQIKTIYLGSEDFGTLNPFNGGTYTIVSCASLRHHKRIHKIAESLSYIDIPVTWHHFGSENLDTGDPKIPEYLKWKEAVKLNPKVNYVIHGYTANEDLLKFYKTEPVNLFISLSEAEGIPVSIMESISFGIPVLSTDVGGCREIVNKQTGILIPLETEALEIVNILKDFQLSHKNSVEFRNGVREFWQEHFNQQDNYNKFLNELDKFDA